MAIPTINSVGAFVQSAGAITPTVGVTHSTNDIDIVICETNNEAIGLATANGFAELTAVSPVTQANQNNTRLTVFWRRWNGSDGDPTTTDSGDHNFGRMISISGCITSGNPWDVTDTNTQDSNTTAASVSGTNNTTVNDCLILAMQSAGLPDLNSTTEYTSEANSNLSSIVLQISNHRNRNAGGGFFMITGGLATAGVVGPTTATAGTSTTRACAMIALKPPVAGGLGIPIAMYHHTQHNLGTG